MTPAFETTPCAGCGREITIARIGETAPALCILCAELDRQAREQAQARLEPTRVAALPGSSAPPTVQNDR